MTEPPSLTLKVLAMEEGLGMAVLRSAMAMMTSRQQKSSFLYYNTELPFQLSDFVFSKHAFFSQSYI